MPTKLARLLDDDPRPDWEIATALAIHPSTLSRYRSGARELPIRHARRIADFYGLTLDDVIGEATPRP